MPEVSPQPDVAEWEAVLDRLQAHVDEIRSGLVMAQLPEPYVVAVPAGPLPAALAPRARRLLAEQRDLENELRNRMGAMAVVLAGAFQAAPIPVYVDRRN